MHDAICGIIRLFLSFPWQQYNLTRLSDFILYSLLGAGAALVRPSWTVRNQSSVLETVSASVYKVHVQSSIPIYWPQLCVQHCGSNQTQATIQTVSNSATITARRGFTIFPHPLKSIEVSRRGRKSESVNQGLGVKGRSAGVASHV